MTMNTQCTSTCIIYRLAKSEKQTHLFPAIGIYSIYNPLN